MKRKIFIVTLIFITILSLSLVLVACNRDTTNKGNGTGTGSGTEVETPHSHSFSSDWSQDGTAHWHKCQGCDEIADRAEHSLDWVIEYEPSYVSSGSKKQVCSVCGWESESVEIEKLAQETPVYSVPTGLVAKCGQTLGDVELPDGFTFESDILTSVGPAGNNVFKVSYTVPGDEERRYKTVTGIEVTVAVSKNAATLTCDWSNVLYKSYTGTAITAPTYDKTGDGTVDVEWYEFDGSSYVLMAAAPINAGDYKVKIILSETETYLGAQSERSFSISKADGVVTINENIDKQYTGSPFEILSSEYSVSNSSYTIEYKVRSASDSTYSATAPTAVGEYTVRINASEDGNYRAKTALRNFEITKQQTTITAVPSQSGTNYVGQSLSSVVLSGGAASVSGTFSWTNDSEKITSVSGSYGVTFTPDDTATYLPSTGYVVVNATQLTIEVNCGENGTANQTGTINVNYGDDYTVSFTPDTGYTIDALTVDGVNKLAAQSYAFNNVTENHSLAVTFKVAAEKYNLALTVTNGSQGTVKVDGTTTSGFLATEYAYGSHSLSVSITNNSYEIKSIKIAGVEQLGEYTMSYSGSFMLYADMTVSVEIGLKVCSVTISKSAYSANYPDSVNHITVAENISYEYTTTYDLAFSLDAGYTLAEVRVFGNALSSTELATAMSGGKIVLPETNSSSGTVSIKVMPIKTTITITKSYLDDDAKSDYDQFITSKDTFTQYYTGTDYVWIGLNYGRKVHIYKDGDTSIDLYSTFLDDRSESNTSITEYLVLNFDKVDVSYEFVFYTEYVTYTFAGENVEYRNYYDYGSGTPYPSTLTVIKYTAQAISVVAKEGYNLVGLKVNGVSKVLNGGSYEINAVDNAANLTFEAAVQRITYTYTISNYKSEYFTTFKIYGKPTADGALTEKVGVVDAVNNTITFTFDWHEYVGKAEITFVGKYKAMSYVYICGYLFNSGNQSYELSTRMDGNVNTEISASVQTFSTSVYLNPNSSIAILNLQYSYDDGATWNDGPLPSYVEFGTSLKLRIKVTGGCKALKLLDGNNGNALLASADSEGLIEYNIASVEKTIYYGVTWEYETHTTDFVVKFYDKVTDTTTTLAANEVETYLDMSDGYNICFDGEDADTDPDMSVTRASNVEDIRAIVLNTGYYVVSATYGGEDLGESVKAGEKFALDFLSDHIGENGVVVVIAQGDVYKTILTCTNEDMTMNSGEHTSVTRFMSDVALVDDVSVTFNVPAGYKVSNIIYTYKKAGAEESEIYYLPYGTSELDSAIASGITFADVSSDINVVVTLAESAVTNISSVDGFKAIASNPDGNYRLLNDIDMSGVDAYLGTEFTGILDGQGYKLYNVTTSNAIFGYGRSYGGTLINVNFEEVESSSTVSAVLFRDLIYGTLDTVTLKSKGGSEIDCYSPLVYTVTSSLIKNCSFTGNLSGNAVSGLVYQSVQTSFDGCRIKAIVTEEKTSQGAFVFGGMVADATLHGYIGSGSMLDHAQGYVVNCHSDINYTINYADGIAGLGWSYAGGLFANFKARKGSVVSDCSAIGDITINYALVDQFVNAAIGGFAGMFIGEATNCMADVNIFCRQNRGSFIGGFIGYTDNYASLTNCVSLSDVTYNMNVSLAALGGFVGYIGNVESKVNNCLSLGTITVNLLEGVSSGTVAAMGTMFAQNNSGVGFSGNASYCTINVAASITVDSVDSTVTNSADKETAIAVATTSWSDLWTINAVAGTVVLKSHVAAWS